MPRPAIIQFTSSGWMACDDADAVAMHDLAVEQVGDRREADVRVRAHVDGLRKTRARSRFGPM